MNHESITGTKNRGHREPENNKTHTANRGLGLDPDHKPSSQLGSRRQSRLQPTWQSFFHTAQHYFWNSKIHISRAATTLLYCLDCVHPQYWTVRLFLLIKTHFYPHLFYLNPVLLSRNHSGCYFAATKSSESVFNKLKGI